MLPMLIATMVQVKLFCTCLCKGPFTRTVSVHCVNGDRLFDGQIGLGTHPACQCKFDGDGDGNLNSQGKVET